MERSALFDMMGELKLYGMRNAYDGVMTTGIKRQHEPPKIVGDLLKADGTMVPRYLSCDSLVALLGMAVAGLGVTYQPLETFQRLIDEGKLKIIPTNPELPEVPYVAMYRQDRPGAFIEKVCELACKICDFATQWQE